MSKPAFPTMGWELTQHGPMSVTEQLGMSERLFIAAMVSSGFIASFAGIKVTPKPDKVAEYSLRVADELIKQSNNG